MTGPIPSHADAIVAAVFDAIVAAVFDAIVAAVFRASTEPALVARGLRAAERDGQPMVTLEVARAAALSAARAGQRSRSLLLVARAVAALSRGLAVHGAAPAVNGEMRAARLLAR